MISDNMIRKKPISQIVILGSFDIEPYKGVDFYFGSKQQNKHSLKPPNYDTPGADTIELMATQNDREHRKMLERQKSMIEQKNIQANINVMHVDTIYRKLASLRESFIETNAFIKNCDEKKQQAKKTVAREFGVHVKLKLANEKCLKDISVLKEFRTNLLAVVKRLEPYERVIEEVVAENPTRFSSVQDCMDRCDAIMLAYAEIQRMKSAKLAYIQTRRKILVLLARDAALKVLKYMNMLTAVERDYETASGTCQKWEKVLEKIKKCIVENQLMQARIIQSVEGMHLLLCNRRGLRPRTRPSLFNQLDFIRDEMRIIEEVFKICVTGKSRF